MIRPSGLFRDNVPWRVSNKSDPVSYHTLTEQQQHIFSCVRFHHTKRILQHKLSKKIKDWTLRVCKDTEFIHAALSSWVCSSNWQAKGDWPTSDISECYSVWTLQHPEQISPLPGALPLRSCLTTSVTSAKDLTILPPDDVLDSSMVLVNSSQPWPETTLAKSCPPDGVVVDDLRWWFGQGYTVFKQLFIHSFVYTWLSKTSTLSQRWSDMEYTIHTWHTFAWTWCLQLIVFWVSAWSLSQLS